MICCWTALLSVGQRSMSNCNCGSRGLLPVATAALCAALCPEFTFSSGFTGVPRGLIIPWSEVRILPGLLLFSLATGRRGPPKLASCHSLGDSSWATSGASPSHPLAAVCRLSRCARYAMRCALFSRPVGKSNAGTALCASNYTEKEGVDLCLYFEVTLIVLESCSRERLFSSLFSYREKNLKLYWQMIFFRTRGKAGRQQQGWKKIMVKE